MSKILRPKEAFLNVFANKMVSRREYFVRGHRACQGCGAALGLRLIFKEAGPNTIAVNATGCMEIISSPYPYTAWKIPWVHVAFENAAAVASGIEAGIKALKNKGKIPADEDINIIAIGGDGGTADIGIQALSGAFARWHKFLYVCYDNEAYMNTGVQGSSATPLGASTTTTPAGKISIGQGNWKKNLPEIAVAHRIPYVATACPAYPLDLMRKVRKALNANGPSYLQILAACPPGWGTPPELTIRISRMAVETGVFPLYEVENGRYCLSLDIPDGLRPIEDYISIQRRYRHLKKENIAEIRKRVLKEYKKLQLLEKMGSEE